MKLFLVVLCICFGAMAAPVDDGMYATLQTTMGDVCFELYYTNTPRTVANFVSLAEGSRPWIDPRSTFVSSEPYYDGIIFHRVITNFMIQCGSPKGDGTDGPGYSFEDEFDSSLRHDRPGIVSMANSGPNSNGGQFFITVADTSHLDDVHSVFGSVVEGMDVVYNIAAVAVDARSKPLIDVTITNVFITRNGTNALNFSVTNQALPEVSALPMTIDGLQLATGTATSSYQYVYSSTNLSDWSETFSGYWPEPDGDWTLQISPVDYEYFRANRVFYTPDTNMTTNAVGHRIVATVDTDIFDVFITGAAVGAFILNSNPEQLVTYWEWPQYPYHIQFRFQASGYPAFWFDLHYESPGGGRCKGYYYTGFFWQMIGTGTFTDTEL